MPRRCSRSIAIAVLALAAAVPATAHAAPGGHAGRLKAALAQLDLTADQKTRIQAIMADAKAERGATAATAGAGRPKGAGRAVLQKVMAVLKPAQQAKLRQLLAADRPRRGSKV